MALYFKVGTFDEYHVDEAGRLFQSQSRFLKLPLCLSFLYPPGGLIQGGLCWPYVEKHRAFEFYSCLVIPKLFGFNRFRSLLPFFLQLPVCQCLLHIQDYVAINLRVLSGRTAWCDMLEEEHRADEAGRLFQSHSHFLKLPLCLPFLYPPGELLQGGLCWPYVKKHRAFEF